MIKSISHLKNIALAIIGIFTLLAMLYEVQILRRNVAENQSLSKKLEPSSSRQNSIYSDGQQGSSDYQGRFLTSSTVPLATWYIVPEQEATGVRLKTIVTR